MSKLFRLVVLISLLMVALPASQAHAQVPQNCVGGLQSSGAVYLICMPPDGIPWNGDLLVYAHGYVAYNEPVGIPQDQLVFEDGTDIPSLVTAQGYAFATTSYRENGLAVLAGLEDILDLVELFKTGFGEPAHTFLAGPSEGGWITTLAIERYPQVFSAGLALCGPVGDFRQQINYWGDFRVLFDYFFPGTIPGSAMNVPQEVIDNWETVYRDLVLAKVTANPARLNELFRVSNAKYALSDPLATRLQTVEDVLWYNVFATNDGIQRLGGIPFNNSKKLYIGSNNDLKLNLKVARYKASPLALAAIQDYQTSGVLRRPLVNMHTTGDPIIPYGQSTLYTAKVLAKKSGLKYLHIPIARYGHCSFTSGEALAGFSLMVLKATGQLPPGALDVLPSAAARSDYQRVIRSKTVE